MSNECPFEVGQRVTDGAVVGRVTSHETIAVAMPSKLGDPSREVWSLAHRVDINWSRWTAFDPADITRHLPKVQSALRARMDELADEEIKCGEWKQRAEQAEARAAEYRREWDNEKAARQELDRELSEAQARVKELEAHLLQTLKRRGLSTRLLEENGVWVSDEEWEQLCPPEGHVAVMLPRNVVHELKVERVCDSDAQLTLREACRNTLETDQKGDTHETIRNNTTRASR